MDKPENGLFKILDVLSRAQYFTANAVRATYGAEPFDPMGTLVFGRRRTSFRNVMADAGMRGAIGKTIGFVGDVFLDPLNLVGIGALTKAGRLAKAVKQSGKTIEELKLLKGALGKELDLAAHTGLNVMDFGKDWAGQLRNGQRMGLSFAGKQIAGTQELGSLLVRYGGKAPEAINMIPVIGPTVVDIGASFGRAAKKLGKVGKSLFSTKTGAIGEQGLELDARIARYHDEKSAYTMRLGIEATDPLRTAWRGMDEADRKILQQGYEFTKGDKSFDALFSAGLSKNGLKVATETRELFKKAFALQKDKGLVISELDDAMEYLSHIPTKKAREALNNVDGMNLGVGHAQLSTKHASLLERTLKGKSIPEANQMWRDGNLLTPGKKNYDLFETDFDAIVPMYMARVAKAIPMKSLIDDVAAEFGKVAELAPPGWVKPSSPYFPTGMVLAPEVSKALDDITGRLINSDGLNHIVDDYYKPLLSSFKTTTLALIPGYYFRNFISAGYMYFITGGMKNGGSLANKGSALRRAMTMTRSKRALGSLGDDIFDSSRFVDDAPAKSLEFKNGATGEVMTGDQMEAVMADKRILQSWMEAETEQTTRAMATQGKGAKDFVKAGLKTPLEGPVMGLFKHPLSPVSANFGPYQWALKKGNGWTEDIFRRATFIDAWERGANVDGAASEVRKLFGDWQDFTPFEKDGMKNIFPFFGWFRKALPPHVEALIKRPAHATVVWKGKQAKEDGQVEQSPEFMKPWIKAGSPVQIRRTADGKHEYLLLDQWLPITTIGKIFDPKGLFTQMLTPFLQEPYEQWANFDTFFKNKIERFPGEEQEFLGMPMDARVSHVLRNIRMINLAHDAFTNEKVSKTGFAAKMTGMRLMQEDVTKNSFFAILEGKKNLKDLEFEKRRNLRLIMMGKDTKATKENLDKLAEQEEELKIKLTRMMAAAGGQ